MAVPLHALDVGDLHEVMSTDLDALPANCRSMMSDHAYINHSTPGRAIAIEVTLGPQWPPRDKHPGTVRVDMYLSIDGRSWDSHPTPLASLFAFASSSDVDQYTSLPVEVPLGVAFRLGVSHTITTPLGAANRVRLKVVA